MTLFGTLHALLLRGLSEGCYPGAAAVCGDASGTLAAAAAGRAALDGPEAGLRTRYDLGSLTKILATTLLALLALEEGRLTLDDALGRFFPEVPRDKKDIRVRQLLAHTGGFEPSFRLDRTVESPEEARGAILSRPLARTPGEEPLYSCLGFILLGFILEGLYGKGLDVLAREKVFEPLGMADTGYLPRGDGFAATELDPKTGKALLGVVHDENARFLKGVSGNAGVFSHAEDMARFAGMLSRGGEGLLSPATLRLAVRCHARGPDTRRGLGFHLAGMPENFMGDLMPPDSFGHTGFPGTSLAVDPQTGFFAVLLSNRIHPSRDNQRLFRFRRLFHNALYAAYLNEGVGKGRWTPGQGAAGPVDAPVPPRYNKSGKSE